MPDKFDNEFGVPDWNFLILPNYYEDDEYWTSEIEEACPEAYTAIANLNNKFRDPREWVKACKIYDKYIGQLIDYYGGKIAVLAYYEENGEYPKGIRLRPKLDKHKENKVFRETGILPPEEGKTIEERIDLAEEIKSTGYDDRMKKINEEGLKAKRAKGKFGYMLSNDFNRIGADNRVSNIYTTQNSLSLDIISSYYNRRNLSSDDSDGIKSDMTLDELVKAYEYDNQEEDWESEADNNPRWYTKYGRVMNGKSLARLEVAKILADNGFHKIVRNMTKSLDDSSDARLIKTELGESLLSKKQKKKADKQYRQYQEEREKRAKADRDLSKALTSDKVQLNNSLRLSDLIEKTNKK